MRKLSLILLAAGAALTSSAAFAQAGHPGPGGPPPGNSWRGGGGGMTGMPAHGPNVQFRHGGGRFMHPGAHFRHGRMQRGFVIPPFWFGSQFHINNWQMYGFSDPGDGRWVRYYDDACLVGRDGRVRDCRYGMDWDRYGEDWDMDDGVPGYRGRHGDDGDDEEWAEMHGGGHGGYGHGMPGPGYGGAYGGYYGYGFYAYPIVIETVTTGGGYYEEVTEEYVEVRHRARARPRCRCAPPRRPPPPRPPAGERG